MTTPRHGRGHGPKVAALARRGTVGSVVKEKVGDMEEKLREGRIRRMRKYVMGFFQDLVGRTRTETGIGIQQEGRGQRDADVRTPTKLLSRS